MKIRTPIIGLVSVLFLAALACSAAGEVLSPEEATQRVLPTAAPTSSTDELSGATYSIGDTVEFVSSQFLILLRNTPGDLTNFATQATRGEKATILDFRVLDGEEWYFVEGPAGKGWVESQYLGTTG